MFDNAYEYEKTKHQKEDMKLKRQTSERRGKSVEST
jgi:hypothetical protein